MGGPETDLDFRLLFESLPGLFVVVLADPPVFSVMAISDAYLRAWQLERESVEGRGFFGLRPGGSNDDSITNRALRVSFENVLKSRQAETVSLTDYSFPGLGVAPRSWSAVNSPVAGAAGEIKFIIHRLDEAVSQAAAKPGGTDERSRAVDSENVFTAAFAEAPVGMVLGGRDGTISDANKAFVRMLGYSRDEVIGMDPARFTHPADVAATHDFFVSFRAGSARPNVFEKRYLHKTGKIVWARVSVTSTQRQEDSRTAATFILIIEDITQRKLAEGRLHAIYDGTYELIALLAPDGMLLETNAALLKFAGNEREELVGRPFWETPWFALTAGAAEAVKQGIVRAGDGEFVRYDATLHRPSGEASTFDISYHPIRDEHGEVTLIVAEGRDITALKMFERRNAFLVRLDDAARPLSDAHEITQRVAGLLAEYLEVSRCAYAEVDQDEDAFQSMGEYNRGVPPTVGPYRISDFGEEFRACVRAGQICFFEDSEIDARLMAVVERCRAIQLRAGIFVPLQKDGRVIGLMSVHSATPRRWAQAEVELVQLVSNRCWESIERARVTQALRDREQRFRFMTESIPQVLWTAKPNGELDFISSQGLTYLGVTEEAGLGAGWLEAVHKDDRENTISRWRQSIETGITYETAYRMRRGSDGSWRWQLVRGVPMRDEHGAIVQWYGTATDIEDQKQAEAGLQQQWQTFDTVLSNGADFNYIFDLEKRFRYANRAVLQLFNKPLEAVVGRNFAELNYPPETAEHLTRELQQVIDTKEAVRDRVSFAGASGEPREYEHIFVPVLDAAGGVRAVTGTSRDVTQQKRAEEVILEDRRRWQDLLYNAPAAVAVLRGPEHKFEWVNAEYLELVGRSSADKLLNKAARDALPEAVSQGFVEMFDGVYQTGRSHSAHEVAVRLGEGTQLRDVYVNFVCMPTRNAQAEIDGTFVHATEVTDLVHARERVEESERQFRTLAETIPHLAWMAHADGQIFWYNRRWYDYTGTTPEEMQVSGWRKFHHPDWLPRVVELWSNAIAKGELLDTMFPLKGADGQFRTFLTRVEPVRDAEGRVVRWFGTNTDITEQKQIEEQLRRMNSDLEEFSHVASHDLQEPIRMINIYSQLLLRAVGATDEKTSQYAAFIQRGVERMEALIRDLLTFSRSVHTDESLSTAADLGDSLQEALDVMKSRIEEQGALVSVPASLPLVRGDTAQLAHVFQNLLSNALKYSKKEIAPEIIISGVEDGSHYVISVQDNGIGFDQKHADGIFGLFKRLHKNAYPGTGLGLAICKRIVERYGGRMWAESAEGEGATFRFSLPRASGEKI